MCPRPALEGAPRGGEGKVQNGPDAPRCVGPRGDAHLGSYLGTVLTSGAHHYGRGNDPIERATTSERQPFYCHARATTHARRAIRRALRVARPVARRATRHGSPAACRPGPNVQTIRPGHCARRALHPFGGTHYSVE